MSKFFTLSKSSGVSCRALFAVLLLAVVSGCGYKLEGGGSVLPDDVQSIYIPVVENDTTVPGLGLMFTEQLRTRFERYGVVQIRDKEPADAVLTANIVKIETRVRDVAGQTDVELQQDLVLHVASELKRSTGQVLWRNKDIQVFQSFGSTSDVVVTSSQSFSEGNISSSSLDSLGSREVARGQSAQVLEDLLVEASRIIYFDSVAADF